MDKKIFPKKFIYLKHFFFLFLNFFLLSIYSIEYGQAATAVNKIEPVKKLKTIIVDNYYPYTFVNEKKEPDGYSVDLAKNVAQAIGLELDIKVDTWENAQNLLLKGEIDFLPMMAYSQERDRLFDFTPPHTIVYDAFFTRKNERSINSFLDIRDKTIIVMKNDRAHEFLIYSGLNQYKKIILTDSLPEALRLLSSGIGDAAVMPKLVGLLQIRNLKLGNIEQSPIIIDSYMRSFCYSVKEGNQLLLERLSHGVSIVKTSEKYNSIHQKWFGAVEPEQIQMNFILKYIFIGIFISLIVVITLLYWSFSLKKQVAFQMQIFEKETAEHRLAEEKIHEKDIQFRKLSSNVPDLIFQFTRKPDGSYFVPIASEGIKNIFGCTPEDVITDFTPIGRVIYPEDTERVINDIEYSAKNLSFFTCEFRVKIPGRPIQWIYSRSTPEALADGSITWYGFNTDITERKLAEEKIIQSLREKETLIREIYHRTKNTMQVIRSIILLQAMEFPENTELQKIVKNTEDKIQAISLVHQMLYKSQDLSRISIKEYIFELTDLILQSFGFSRDRISLNIKIDDQEFLLDTAIPFGLIINELMTNSLTHAFPENRKGMINISLNCDDSDKNILYYSDNGVGVDACFDFRGQNTLGLKLIYNIGELQMMGKVVFENNNGISCLIEFPAKLYKARV